MSHQEANKADGVRASHQFSEPPDQGTVRTVNFVISALSAGAVIGSIFLPGIGTLVGSMIGGVLGGAMRGHLAKARRDSTK